MQTKLTDLKYYFYFTCKLNIKLIIKIINKDA